MRQKRITQNLGRDTHVRDQSQNIFQNFHKKSYQMLMGEIKETQPEPLFTQNMVKVKLAEGDEVNDVSYPGAFIDPESKNLHGLYEGPIPGQMVLLGFEDGNIHAPFVVNRYPYQGYGDTNTEEDYKTPLTNAKFNPADVMLGHHSGSFLVFNEGSPLTDNGNAGSVKLYASTEFLLQSDSEILFEAETSAEINTKEIKFIGEDLIEAESKKIILTGSDQIELNGNSNYAVKYTELKSGFDTMKTDLNTFINTVWNIFAAAYVPGGPTVVGMPLTALSGTPTTADITSAKNDTVLM